MELPADRAWAEYKELGRSGLRVQNGGMMKYETQQFVQCFLRTIWKQKSS